MIETNKKHKGAQENQRGQWQVLTGSCRWWGWSCVSYWTLLVQNGMCQTYITTAHGRIRCSFFQRNITKGTFTILLIDNRPRRCVLDLTVTLLSAFSSFCRIQDYYGIGGAFCHEKGELLLGERRPIWREGFQALRCTTLVSITASYVCFLRCILTFIRFTTRPILTLTQNIKTFVRFTM